MESFIDRPKPLELNITQIDLPVNNPGGDPITIKGARVYNDSAPGPTFRVNSGGTISINVNNNLSSPGFRCPLPEGANEWEDNCYNTTNMHFHGLHVSPSSIYGNGREKPPTLASDDVLIKIDPQNSQKYCVVLPDFHAPGTHWYHSHRHGSTGVQASSGMVGAIIVTDPKAPELTPAIPEKQDLVFVMQEVVRADNQESVYITPGRLANPDEDPSDGKFLINGELRPTLTIEKGKIMRWRFINGTATPRGFANLKLCPANGPGDETTDCVIVDEETGQPVINEETGEPEPANIPMNLIAVDGILFYGNKPQPQSTWELSPGNRADFLVQFSDDQFAASQWYKIVKDIVPGVNAAKVPQVLAYVHVTNSDAKPETMPTLASTPPKYLEPIKDDDIIGNPKPPQTTIEFSIPTPGSPPARARNATFFMDGARYQMDCINHEVMLNTQEEWKLTNTSGSPHPFHIHVNPFQVKHDLIVPKENGGKDEPSNWRWWDTIAVRKGKDLTIRHRFTDYPGEFVVHCHILVHEDLGMMQNIKVMDDGTGVGPCCNVSPDGSSNCSNPPIFSENQRCSNFS